VGEAGATPRGSQGAEPEAVPVVVVIASYRRPAYLARALQSVVSQQKVRPLEIVVVDDGSRDGTAQLASSFGARVIEKKHKEGLSAARNDGIRMTTSGYPTICSPSGPTGPTTSLCPVLRSSSGARRTRTAQGGLRERSCVRLAGCFSLKTL
jgi:cellulose synthase/poly-beta-1,6-N-acetylglucosamine synthase-like glycosyltransferase